MEEGRAIKGYELRERIGSGGFGVVYRAYQTTVGREVAIKIILPHFANHPDFIRRFETEAQLIARLEHLHIVPLYDYWRDPDGAYLVMRWLRGGSLRDKLKEGPLELEAAAQILDQIASALDLAHRYHVVHRDLKPGNVLLDEDGNAYLSDFGIAKDVGDPQGGQTGSGMIVGSPDYLAPEQARSDPVTPQTDIYSLGVMLYEMLTGEHPFPDKTPVERMYKHLNDPLPLLSNLPDDVSSSVNAIIQKATAKNPAHRYASALEVAATFREGTALSTTQAGGTLVEQLTLREQEILRLIIDGCSNQEIAQRLFVTVGTVKWYVWQLYRKLRVRSRVQAIVRARELNLIVSEAGAEPTDAEATYVALPEPENPYKGLRSFEAADARDFFGREKLVQKLVKRLGEDHKPSRFLAVVGPSGSGKSSVVKAGVIPALWRGDLPGSDRWFVVEMVPGTRPLDELEVALTRIAATYADNLRQHLERDENGLLRVAGLILPNDGSELVIVVDQFEEVFTLVQDEPTRAHFLKLIHAAVTDPRSRVRVIVTLRADFYDRPLYYPELGELVRSHMETVLPLSADELEAAVVKPAERVGVSFDPGLAATIISDSHYQPGALPLLQYALTELFEQREGRTLTLKAYQSLGGAVGALAQRADEIYLEQSPEGREAIRQMFLRLVTLGEDAEETRRRTPRSELLAVATNPEMMDELIDTYTAYRLLTLDHDPVTRSPTVEMAHEAILREWSRLRSWLDASRHDIRQQRLLAAAAAEWQQANCDKSYLLHGARLDQFAGWSAETGLALTQQERDYLETGLAQRTHEEKSERERQQKELELARQAAQAAQEAAISQRQAANRLRYFVAGLAIFLVAAIGLSFFAFGKQRQAQDARIKAEREATVNHSLVLAGNAEDVFGAGKTDLALALALEAIHINQPPLEAEQALRTVALGPGTRTVLRTQGNTIKTVGFSPDTRLALSGSCGQLDVDNNCIQGELILWNLATYSEVRRFEGHTDWVNSVVFSADGKTALSGSGDNTLILWDVATGEIIRRFEGHTGGVNSVAFSAVGKTALSGSGDNTLILWDVATGEIIRRFEGHSGGVNSVAFSPDGLTVVSGADDKTLILWNIATGEIIHSFQGHNGSVTAVAFTPDGTTLWSSSADMLVHVWNIGTGGELTSPINLGAASHCLTIAPNGRAVIVGTLYQLRVISTDQHQVTQYLNDHYPASIYSVAISSNGQWVLSGSADGALRLWNLEGQMELGRYSTDWRYTSLSVNRDGRYVLMGTGGPWGDGVLWDTKSNQVVHRFDGPDGQVVLGVDISPDNHYVLIGSGNWGGGDTELPSLTLWDTETGEQLHRFEGYRFNIRSVAISPDSHTALAGSQQYLNEKHGLGELILWDLETGNAIRQFDDTQDITAIQFSADGSRALTSSAYGQNVTLWDVSTGKALKRLDYPVWMLCVRLAPGETTALASTSDNSLVLLNLQTGEIIRRFVGHNGIVWHLDISPDGRYAISIDTNGIAILWDFETGTELRRLSGHKIGWSSVVFSPDGQTAWSASAGDTVLIHWQVAEQPLNDLLVWTHANRYIRDFTCEEGTQYRIEPLCKTPKT